MSLVQTSGVKVSPSWSTASRQEDAASSFTVGNTVIVSMAYYSDFADLTSVVIAGTTATRAVIAPSPFTVGLSAMIYYAKIVNASRTDVVMNGDTNAKFTTLSIEEWSGVMDSPLDTAVAAGRTTSTSPSATSGTLAQANELVYFAFGILTVNQSSITNPADYTSVWEALVADVTLGGEGYYRIVAATTTQSPTATLATSDTWAAAIASFKLVVGPTISAQPTSQTSYTPNTATFTITATGTGTLHYQWKKNESNVGTDSSSYTTAASTNADSGAYVYCVVTDDNASTNSSQVRWIVIGAGSGAWVRA